MQVPKITNNNYNTFGVGHYYYRCGDVKYKTKEGELKSIYGIIPDSAVPMIDEVREKLKDKAYYITISKGEQPLDFSIASETLSGNIKTPPISVSLTPNESYYCDWIVRKFKYSRYHGYLLSEEYTNTKEFLHAIEKSIDDIENKLNSVENKVNKKWWQIWKK